MAKYKRQKLKNSSGQYIVSPSMADMVYYPNGETVEKKYTDLKNEITENFSKTNAQLSTKATENDLIIERNRINSFTSLTDGSTTGDAELIDGRVGSDGVNYDNIGDAIRNQVSQLKDEITDVFDTKIFKGKLIDGGYIHSSSGLTVELQDSSYSDFIEVKPSSHLRFNNIFVRGSRAICAYNLNKDKITTLITNSEQTDFEGTIPDNAHYIRVTGKPGSLCEVTTVGNIQNQIDTLENSLIYKAGLHDKDLILNLSDGKYISVGNGGNDNIGVDWTARLIDDINSKYLPNALDVSKYRGYTLVVKAEKISTGTSTRAFGLCDESNKISKPYTYQTITKQDEKYYYYRIEISDTHFFFSKRIDQEVNVYIELDEIKKRMDEIYIKTSWDNNSCYVSKLGSDSNDGTLSKPKRTVNGALSSGAKDIRIFGGVYEEKINFALSNQKAISICRHEKDKEVTFVSQNRILINSETKVDGYIKVYSCTVIKTIHKDNVWLFQDGVSDVKTIIIDSERHPLQRGYEYRCNDTKIEKVSATELLQALEEIDNSDEYKWFLDENTLYFSRPINVTTNPICYSDGTSLFENTKDMKLRISGISSKYLCFNVLNTIDSEITDCKSSNVWAGGAFRYDSSMNCKFIRCEASRAYNGVNGDGFNGHCSNTGDIFSKQLTATFVDCWAHDNNDDGYSDHERAETTIIGGLYEYNKKGGVTPSYGAHVTCYNVLSRQNFCGFYYTGKAETSEGGKYGQLICFNCVAENNVHGGKRSGYAVDGSNNRITLINCKSINNINGYNSTGAGGNVIELIDCGSLNDEIIKQGVITVKNTTIVN